MLLHNLETTHDQFEQAQQESNFWKESYFQLREACQQYVSANGLAPFDYIVALETELKHEKVYKSCLEEKYKVMRPSAHSAHKRTPTSQHTAKHSPQTDRLPKQIDASPSTRIKESPEPVRMQNKHKIGPKSIEFFKFKDNRQT